MTNSYLVPGDKGRVTFASTTSNPDLSHLVRVCGCTHRARLAFGANIVLRQRHSRVLAWKVKYSLKRRDLFEVSTRTMKYTVYTLVIWRKPKRMASVRGVSLMSALQSHSTELIKSVASLQAVNSRWSCVRTAAVSQRKN